MTKDIEQKLLTDWEEVFRQGLLNFWILTALKDASMSVGELCDEIAKLTNNLYMPAEQSLYRVLRKNYSLDLVSFTLVPGNSGPEKKLYSLSTLGERLLQDFTKRNIELFSSVTKSKNDEHTKP
jgi:DNA-binding PadR family transcriptional regulator